MIIMCKKIENLEGYNGTEGFEDLTYEDPEGHDAFLDHEDNHFTDEEKKCAESILLQMGAVIGEYLREALKRDVEPVRRTAMRIASEVNLRLM